MNVRIGDLLVQRGVTTVEVVERAVRTATARGIPLLSQLLHEGVDEGALAAALAERFRVPGVDLSRTCISLDAVGIVPRPVAEADLMLPLSLEGGRVHLAMSRPLDERVISEVRFVTGMEVSPYAAIKAALEHVVADAYDRRARGEHRWRGAAGPAEPHLAVHLPGVPDDGLEVVEIVEDEILPAEVVIDVEPEPDRDPGLPLALVVDDEPEIRQLVLKALTGHGWRVETAADGEEGVARAEALRPDVVVLDAMLPRLHGFEACLRLKSNPRTRHIPVVMMTAIYRGWRYAEDAREQFGAVDYIEKPFRLDDLVRRVAAAREVGASRPRAEGPGPAEPLVKRARELLAAGDVTGALDLLAEAVRSDPYAAEAHHQLGRALRARGDAFGAMTALERAADLRPGHLAALRALAALYEEKGFRRNAAGALERALAVASDDAARATLRAELLRLIP
ncbi:MAG: response regulator [Anaeromyxobacter sp.]